MEFNDCETNERTIAYVKERVKLKNIIPNYIDKPKIKIRFSHTIYFFLNSIKTIIEYYQKGLDIDLLMIIGQSDRRQDIPVLVDQIKDIGVNYCIYDQYNIEEDKPDIIIFNIAHNKNIFDTIGGTSKIRKNASFVVVVPYDQTTKMEREAFAEYYNALDSLKQDLLIVNPINYDVFVNRYQNTYMMPNPKNDIVYQALENDCEIPQEWREKAVNRKVLLWSTVHGHEAVDLFAREVTFDVYVKDILRYFSDHKDMVLLFRPHPVLIEEYVKMHHIWTENELRTLKDYFHRSDNLIWDDTQDYAVAFKLSDALLVDTATGVSFSYLPTQKPICIVYRSKDLEMELNPELVEHYYKAYCWSEVEKYFEMINAGEDYMHGERMHTLNRLIPKFDGKNGERIAQFILNKFKSIR